MTAPDFDNLEKQLAQLTEWHDRPPGLWRKALRTAGKSRASVWQSLLNRPLRTVLAACVALAIVGTATWQTSEMSHRGEHLFGVAQEARPAPVQADAFWSMVRKGYSCSPKSFICPSSKGESEASADNPQHYWNRFYDSSVKFDSAGTSPEREVDGRQVIRKVNIQLASSDVRATYLRAAHLISEAQGEYVQESGLTGTGAQVQANLTLRVAATRLSQVLDALRELGTVDSEQATGEDVTNQVVDTEARLRNEQRIEAELLKLLESRKDAPLTELLQLRDKLSEVRNSIERMTAERERLGRLVNLATILVIIRPADAPPPARPGLSDYFSQAISSAWSRSVRFLVDTVALLMGIVIGGAIWLVLLIIAIILLVRSLRRKNV